MNESGNDVWQSRHEHHNQRDEYHDLMDVARLAYIYGFPSYQMARMRFRAFKQPHARLNSLHHVRSLPTHTTGRVTTGNTDVLKSTAWLDLSREPFVIHVPGTADRYYSLTLVDFFANNFAVLGRRSSGLLAGNFLLAGPRWEGAAPAGMTVIRTPTNAVLAVVRILVYGPNDQAAVRALQDQFTISRSGLPSANSPRSPHPLSSPVRPLHPKNLLTFFDVLNAVLTENPPPAGDKAILDRLETIGVGPSLRFNRGDFTQPQLNALRQGVASARDAIQAHGSSRRRAARQEGPRHWPSDALLAQLRGPVDGSRVRTRGAGRRGWSCAAARAGELDADYLRRARHALRSIGGLSCEDAMYFFAATDALGDALDGRNHYVMRFPPAGLPPVDAFWSLTASGADKDNRRSLVPNANNRYSLGNHTPGLRYGSHGSLEILIQHDRPKTNEENWLAAPEGPFQLTLRAYLPRRELLDGGYAIPKVRPLSE